MGCRTMNRWRLSVCDDPGRPASQALGRGFTLLELLAVIAVLGILLAVLLPALASVFAASRETVSLSNVRQLHTAVDAYTIGRDGEYPAFEDGEYYPTTGLGNAMFAFPYWQVATHWTGAVFGTLEYSAETEAVFVSPGSPRSDGPGIAFPSSYHYSTSFAGLPSLWSGSAAADMSLRRPSRTEQVRWPEAKVLLWDFEVPWNDARSVTPEGDLTVESPMAFADGSARTERPIDASAAVENPFEHAWGRARLHNTPDGVRGRDY